jgi:hypothetical protein
MRDGFPDLMLVGDETVSFLEIKAEGDVIRRHQLTRLRQLQAAGITAEIGRVDYPSIRTRTTLSSTSKPRAGGLPAIASRRLAPLESAIMK